VILRCLEKQPSARFASAADVRESLKTIMMKMQLDSVVMPGDSMALLPSQSRLALPSPEEEKRTTGILSMLAERFREPAATAASKQNSIVVLPFVNLGNHSKNGVNAGEVAPLYGYALADAIGARLARMPSLVVRPSSTLMAVSTQQLDPLSVGKKLLVHYVLAGNFLRSDKGFDLNWQLLDVPGQSVRAGGSINVESFDLISVQTEICNAARLWRSQGRGRQRARCVADAGPFRRVSAGAGGAVVVHLADREPRRSRSCARAI
jgi:TolB-like protein